MAVSFSFKNNPIAKLSRAVTSWVRKYDQNWWARFVKIAHEEDIQASAGIGDPLKSHAWVNIAVHAISSNIARVPFKIYNGETQIIAGKIFELFNRPNPLMTGKQLFEATAAWMKVKGECFWVYDLFLEQEKRSGMLPQQIGMVEPDKMEHRKDANGNISLWLYHKEGDKKPIPIMPDEMIHFKYWNKWNPWRGASPLIAMDQELAMDNLSDQSNLNILQHGSIPDGVISTDQYLSPEQAQQIKTNWLNNHQGSKRKNMVSVLGQGTTYQAIQMTPQDMEYLAMKRWDRQTILARYGVPGVLVGVTDDRAPMSGSDTKYQRKVFWNLTLIPDLDMFEDIIRDGFFKRFNIPLVGEFDTDEIPELQEDEQEKVDRWLKEVTQGTLTINEMREMQERDPVPWGDSWWVSMAMVPADSAPAPVSPEPPTKDVTPPVSKLFEKKAKYSKLFKDLYWKQVIRSWEKIEADYRKDLVAWGYAQRSRALEIISRQKAVDNAAYIEVMSEQYWLAETVELKRFSKTAFYIALGESDELINALFNTLGIEIRPNWSIFNTSAVQKVNERVNKVTNITETVRKQVDEAVKYSIKNGLSEEAAGKEIRGIYNKFQNRAKTIARTEIGTVMNESRIEAYSDLGYERHEWLTSRDDDVRDNHRIDGEVATLGTPFSNTLLWPNDENAAAEDVINCRCITVPVVGDK